MGRVGPARGPTWPSVRAGRLMVGPLVIDKADVCAVPERPADRGPRPGGDDHEADAGGQAPPDSARTGAPRSPNTLRTAPSLLMMCGSRHAMKCRTPHDPDDVHRTKAGSPTWGRSALADSRASCCAGVGGKDPSRRGEAADSRAPRNQDPREADGALPAPSCRAQAGCVRRRCDPVTGDLVLHSPHQGFDRCRNRLGKPLAE